MKTHKQLITVVCVVVTMVVIFLLGPENMNFLMERAVKSLKELTHGLEGMFFPLSACFFVVTCVRWLLKDFFKD